MRLPIRFVLGASLAMGTGCSSAIEVRTMAAPEASFSTVHTFRILPGPTRRDGGLVTGADDPMISNSIANRAIRARIVRAFQDRGYELDETNPDVAVAFYATAREKLDASVWDYGYPFTPGSTQVQVGLRPVSTYVEGSVVIDVIAPQSRSLMWRGEGRATLSDEPTENVKQLAKAAESIVAQFPRATNRVVAVHQ